MLTVFAYGYVIVCFDWERAEGAQNFYAFLLKRAKIEGFGPRFRPPPPKTKSEWCGKKDWWPRSESGHGPMAPVAYSHLQKRHKSLMRQCADVYQDALAIWRRNSISDWGNWLCAEVARNFNSFLIKKTKIMGFRVAFHSPKSGVTVNIVCPPLWKVGLRSPGPPFPCLYLVICKQNRRQCELHVLTFRQGAFVKAE